MTAPTRRAADSAQSAANDHAASAALVCATIFCQVLCCQMLCHMRFDAIIKS